MNLRSRVIATSLARAAREFEKLTADPKATQLNRLRDMMRRNADTDYGRRFGFSAINSVADYQKQVPVVDYEAIKDDMNRVAGGALNVFTTENPKMFAQTSGTTGDPKYVPITSTCQGRIHQVQMRTWMSHAQSAHRDVFDGKIVSLTSPAIEGYTESGIPFGSTSGHIYKNMPRIIRNVYSIPYETFEIEDYQAKYYTIMRLSLEHDVRFLATANPSSILKLADVADTQSEQLIRDIRDGTLSTDVHIDESIRQSLQRTIRPNPARANELGRLRAKRNGRMLPGDYWPRLSLIGCWKGGTVGHYLDRFPSLFDPNDTRPVPVRDWGYLSSEARGSIPLSDEGSQGVLTIGANFFEFVEVDDLTSKPDNSSAWTFHTADELTVGREYYIFLTTTGGLYRYDINDIVKVTGQYNQTPQIVFLRKGRGMTNLTGEKVSVNQIITAFQNAAKATATCPDHFKAEADAGSSRYVFRVEFSLPVDNATQRTFLSRLDQEMMDLNIEYKAKRDSGRLNDPVLHVMREGWYERNRSQIIAQGKRAFQTKTELLSPTKAETRFVKPDLVNVVEMDDDA